MNEITKEGDVRKEKDSFVNGANDREAYPKYWIALFVKMNSERSVGLKLSKMGIVTYVPTQKQVRQWSDRKKTINKVMIPMVVFAQVDRQIEKRLISYSFIHKLLSYPGEKDVAIIPDDQIEKLRFMLNNADSEVQISDNILEEGMCVRVIRGPLRGLEGELCNVVDRNISVAIRINCLGCACVNVSKCDIEITEG